MAVPSTPVPSGEPTLREILGGRRAAVDASLPVAAFVVAWVAAETRGVDGAVVGASVAALAVGLVVATVALARGGRPRAVLVGLLGVAVAAAVALSTGRAADFFLVQIVSNAASALAWAVSIVLRRPLLGLIVGAALGQRTRWRRDPDLLRAYQRASWVWVGQYLVRLAVFLPLWAVGSVWALGTARLVLTWPLVAACIAVSWAVLRSALPAGHGGLRHPQTGDDRSGS